MIHNDIFSSISWLVYDMPSLRNWSSGEIKFFQAILKDGIFDGTEDQPNILSVYHVTGNNWCQDESNCVRRRVGHRCHAAKKIAVIFNHGRFGPMIMEQLV